MIREKGIVLWITGLSGSGKTSIAHEVYKQFRQHKNNVVLLDGDVVRNLFGNDLGHSPDDRLTNAWRLCRLCWMLSEQGIDVVCATMSLFKECHIWNSENLSEYYEILVDVPMDVLKKRDAKQIYSRVERGDISGVVGVDMKYDLPEMPHLTVKNVVPTDTFHHIASQIIESVPKLCRDWRNRNKG